jgi:hypothetical protein
MYKYIEIIKDKTGEVVSRMDVTTQSERNVERIWRGISLNLNHSEFSIKEVRSEIELLLIKM